ncbi:MAG: DNA repair protein RecO [Clostridia bacterium]|nr:DNA repair protein RecO [Clostridia bacterium]
MVKEVRGLVVRTVDIKESDRLVVIYTEEEGIVTALARSARSIKSRKLSSTMQFCYGSYVLFGEGDKLYIREASLIESFFDIRSSIEGLALAGYVAEVLTEVGTTEGDRELLRVSLNTLYAIGQGKHELDKIKAAFEIRVAAILGFMPEVMECHSCGRREGDFFLDVMAGAVECADCRRLRSARHEPMTDPHESHIVAPLSEGAKTALAYCIYSPPEKLLSFSVEGDDLRLFSRAAEKYLLNHLERGFKTLDFYNEVKR